MYLVVRQYPLEDALREYMTLPVGAEILAVTQSPDRHGSVLSVLQYSSTDCTVETRLIVRYESDKEYSVNDTKRKYIGSVCLDATTCYHYFEETDEF